MTFGTARTLMVRIGVRPDIAERVLGHAIPGVAEFTTATTTSRRSVAH